VPTLAKGVPPSHALVRHPAAAFGAALVLQATALGPGGSVVSFGCEDCAVEEARVEPAGGKVVRPKMSIGPFGCISLFTDSEGKMIGLHSMA
jgi:predicted enzyme related to lactoylglutathione lyase